MDFLLPYEFAPLVWLACGIPLLIYVAGLRRRRASAGFWKPLSFLVGLGLMFMVSQTQFDYYAQYMFFMHRLQHLVLHHLGPFLIALSAPAVILAAGLPSWARNLTDHAPWFWAGLKRLYLILQQPIIAAVLFVGLIYFWLIPDIHFDAMLSRNLYWIMNWSMAIDGLLFWWLMLENRRGAVTPKLGYGFRMVLLGIIMVPQIIIGAWMALSRRELFDVYSVCGRAWPLDPMTDQQIGGLITWIPAAMMSVLGAVVVLRFWLHDREAREPRPRSARR